MKLCLARSSGPDINNILDILEQECFLTKTKYYHIHVGIKWEVMVDIWTWGNLKWRTNSVDHLNSAFHIFCFTLYTYATTAALHAKARDWMLEILTTRFGLADQFYIWQAANNALMLVFLSCWLQCQLILSSWESQWNNTCAIAHSQGIRITWGFCYVWTNIWHGNFLTIWLSSNSNKGLRPLLGQIYLSCAPAEQMYGAIISIC